MLPRCFSSRVTIMDGWASQMTPHLNLAETSSLDSIPPITTQPPDLPPPPPPPLRLMKAEYQGEGEGGGICPRSPTPPFSRRGGHRTIPPPPPPLPLPPICLCPGLPCISLLPPATPPSNNAQLLVKSALNSSPGWSNGRLNPSINYSNLPNPKESWIINRVTINQRTETETMTTSRTMMRRKMTSHQVLTLQPQPPLPLPPTFLLVQSPSAAESSGCWLGATLVLDGSRVLRGGSILPGEGSGGREREGGKGLW